MSRISDLVKEGFKETRETGEELKKAGDKLREINKHAQELGSLGGIKSAQNLTPEERSKRAKKAVEAREIKRNLK